MVSPTAHLTVLHLAGTPSALAPRRLRLQVTHAEPSAKPELGGAEDLAILELPLETIGPLAARLRASQPELALVALLPADAAGADPVALGVDEVLYAPAEGQALDLALRAAVDRRRAERRSRQAAQEHVLAARALEEVVSAASHDLRSPLSVIIGYGGLLLNELRGELGPQAVEPTRKILRGAERLESLIRDVVTFARLDREQGASEPLNTALCAKLAAEELEEERAAVSARIEIGTLPTALGNSTFVQATFAELIRNALRFGGRQGLLVRIEGHREGERAHFSVSDDGVGFDPRHRTDVFRLFRRLAPRTAETRGDGLGLAQCRRMVELMGGEIGLDTAPGQGVRVWFTLPGGDPEPGRLP